jgi:hypothetical protein
MTIQESFMKKNLLVFLFLACVISLSFAKKTPDWINGTSSKYPDKDYFIGVGIGNSLDSARSNARAEIAKIFQARVMQVSQSQENESKSYNDTSSKYSSAIQNESTTQVITDQILQGVEIVETYQKKKDFYALAVLSKQKVKFTFMQNVLDEEQKIKNNMDMAKKAVSVVEKIKFLTLTLEAIDKRDEASSKRKIVDPMAVPEIDQISRVQIEKDRNDAISKIIFIVNVKDQSLYSAITQEITKLNLRVEPIVPKIIGDNYVIIIKANITTEPVERDTPNWKFYRWYSNITMQEASGDKKLISSHSEHGDVSHTNTEAAKTKADLTARDIIGSSVRIDIEKLIFGK